MIALLRICFICCLVYPGWGWLCAQEIVLDDGEIIYRYTAQLNNPVTFGMINLNRLDFACVDKLAVERLQVPAGQTNLVSPSSLKESFTRDDDHLYINGFRGRDPFLNVPAKEIVFLTPVMYGWSGHTAKKHEGSSEFILSYDRKDLPASFRGLPSMDGVNSVQITGILTWELEALDEERFYDMTGRVEGAAFSHIHNYKVKGIRLRTNEWKDISPSSFPALWALFRNREYRFRNFFGPGDALDRVRIHDYPEPSITYHTVKPFFGLEACNHRGMELYVFPNPTYGDLNLQISNGSGGTFRFAIYNIIGKELWGTDIQAAPGIYQEELNLPSLPKGVYLYRVTDARGDILKSKRLIIIEP